MSKIIYYLGAGASCGKKNVPEGIGEYTLCKDTVFHDGLPVVSEIPQLLLAFKESVKEEFIDTKIYYNFTNRHRHQTKGSDIYQKRNQLVEKIDFLYKVTANHATIDTFAKKLYLTEQYDDFKLLKDVLCLFFIWVQVVGKVDQRYDTFLANILQKNLEFPKEISVISWNYDSQFEMAYKYYSEKGTLSIFDKNCDGELPQMKNVGRIFKVNGSANFEDYSAVRMIKNEDVSPIIQLIECYDHLTSDTSETIRTPFHSHLSFAWETSDKQNSLMNYIEQTTMDTETIVVIGYSFPFFNREIDRAIFAKMPNLRTIYIQDPRPDAVEPSLKAVIPEKSNIRIEHITNCDQFYLPREL